MPNTATKPSTRKTSKVVELSSVEKATANSTDSFATASPSVVADAIAECEQKIEDIKALKKGNAAVQKKRQREIAKLEKEILKQNCLRDFKVGDYVTTGADKGRLGVILDVINGSLLEYLISWEGTVTPIPSSFDVVIKVEPNQIEWQWKEGKLIREFDFLECNDLAAINKELDPIKKKRDAASKKKVTYLTALWNGLVKNVFSKDDLVRYENKVYIVTGHREPVKSQLFHCLAKPHGAKKEEEIILINPVELEVLSMSQQYLNIAAVREYPCQMELLISELTIDQRLQQRVKYNKEAIATYQENVDQMPPVKVILDDLGNFWLWDGFHTVYACKAIEKLTVTADVEKGNFDEAFLRSLGANAKRGVQRTKADRQRAAIQALRAREEGTLLDDKGKRPSNRWIADQIENISRGTIDALYKQLYETPQEPKTPPQQQELITDTGKGKKGKDASTAQKTTKETTKEDDKQALSDSQSKQHNLPDTGAPVETETTSGSVAETSTVIGDSFVDVSQATERAKITYEVGEVVYIRNDAEDPRVKNLVRQNALIEDSGEFAVTIRLWSGKTLNISKNDIAKTQAKISSLVQINQENYAQLMKNYDSWEAATKGINEILQHALSPVTVSEKSSEEKATPEKK